MHVGILCQLEPGAAVTARVVEALRRTQRRRPPLHASPLAFSRARRRLPAPPGNGVKASRGTDARPWFLPGAPDSSSSRIRRRIGARRSSTRSPSRPSRAAARHRSPRLRRSTPSRPAARRRRSVSSRPSTTARPRLHPHRDHGRVLGEQRGGRTTGDREHRSHGRCFPDGASQRSGASSRDAATGRRRKIADCPCRERAWSTTLAPCVASSPLVLT